VNVDPILLRTSKRVIDRELRRILRLPAGTALNGWDLDLAFALLNVEDDRREGASVVVRDGSREGKTLAVVREPA
jgi:hypothetical protein